MHLLSVVQQFLHNYCETADLSNCFLWALQSGVCAESEREFKTSIIMFVPNEQDLILVSLKLIHSHVNNHVRIVYLWLTKHRNHKLILRFRGLLSGTAFTDDILMSQKKHNLPQTWLDWALNPQPIFDLQGSITAKDRLIRILFGTSIPLQIFFILFFGLLTPSFI